MTGGAPWRVASAPGPVAADAPDAPTIGVVELHQRVGAALTGAFPDRLWLCGEVVGTPAVRASGAGIAFTLGEADGETVSTLRAWLGRPYYPELRRDLGDAAIAELLTAGNLLVVGGRLTYGGPFNSLELRVDRVVRTAAGAGAVSQHRETLEQDLAASGLLGRQRAAFDSLPLAPLRVGIVAGGAGTVGYKDAVDVLEQSGHQVVATHYEAPLEGEAAPARIAARIRDAAVGSQVILVVRGGGEDAQLGPFDSAQVVTAIATAPVPVITGIGHSRNRTLADVAAYRACVSPAAAGAVIAERLQAADRNLNRELTAIRAAAKARLASLRAARRWRRGGFGLALTVLAGLAGWQGGWPAALVVLTLAVLAALLVRRRRPAGRRLEPQPAAAIFDDVVQELGEIKARLQQTPVTSEDVGRLLAAASWLEHRGGELLGRGRATSPTAA
jgi:exodeoxyribonuclease VII large subunit